MGKPIGLGIRPRLRLKKLLEWARLAEASGFSSLWMVEAMGFDSMATLSSIAQITSRILLGTGVVSIYLRPPLLALMGGITLNEASGGRFRLGIGVSHRESVEGSLGVGYEKPYERMKDYLDRMRRARLEINAIERPPIYIGTVSPRIARLAGREADGVLFYLMTPDHASRLIEEVRKGEEERGKRGHVKVSCYVPCYVGDRREGARVLTWGIARSASLENYNRLLKRCGFTNEAASIAEALRSGKDITIGVSSRLIDGLCAFGSREECLAKLEEYRRAGVDEPIAYINYPPDLGHEPIERSIASLLA